MPEITPILLPAMDHRNLIRSKLRLSNPRSRSGLAPAESVHSVGQFAETCLECGDLRSSLRRATCHELGLSPEEARVLVESYAVTGLLHDFDYEKYPSPEEHPWIGNRILTDQGWPEEVRHAIMGHAEYTHTPRESHLDKVLFACDELAGFLTANALVKPTKSIRDVNVTSVLKKMKDKAFARGVNRDDIVVGAAELGVDLPDHVAFCLAAMQQHAEELGLSGVTM